MKLIKKILVVVLTLSVLATVCVGLFACGNKKDSNKLYVGLECAYAPFNFTQTDNANGAVPIYNTNYKQVKGYYANGYDVMIAKKIAEELGKELVIVKMDWDPLIPALTAGTIDMIIAGMSPTAKRKETIDFSDAYYNSQLVVVVRSNSAYANATSLSELSGAKITAQIGTFHLDALNAQGPDYGITNPYPDGLTDFPTMITMLKTTTNIDGYVAEEPGAIENCTSNPEFTYIHLTNNDTGFSCTEADSAVAVGIKKGSALTAQVNAALAKISASERDTIMRNAISWASGANVEE